MNKHFKFPFWNPELEQVVEDFIKSVQVDNTKDFGWSWTRPLANIEESPESYIISLAAPGLEKPDFNLSVDQNILKVTVDKPKTENSNKKLKSEFSYHHFTRNFKISQDVNKESIKAAYANGVLIITLPKKEGAQDSPKTINIL